MQSAIANSAELKQVVERIVERFRPCQIILFGSHARGEGSADSDVDLLVVLDTDVSPLLAAAQISAALPHPFPLDIVVRTPADLRQAIDGQYVFETEISRQGIVLYEAENAWVDREGGRRLGYTPIRRSQKTLCGLRKTCGRR